MLREIIFNGLRHLYYVGDVARVLQHLLIEDKMGCCGARTMFLYSSAHNDLSSYMYFVLNHIHTSIEKLRQKYAHEHATRG